jgi:hypothetical protein
MIRHSWLMLLAAGALFACGGSAENTSTGANSAGAGAQGGSGASGSTTGPGAGGGACDVPPDSAGPTVTVNLVNNTGQNLYLGNPTQGCDPYLAFSLDKNDQPLVWSLGSCAFTCMEQLSGSCACPADCAAPVITMLAPDGVYKAEWQGSVYSSATLPTGCAAEGCADGACPFEEPAEGPIGFTASAYTGASGCDPGACMCTPDANGTCIIDFPATVSGEIITAKATLEKVTATSIDIVFDVPQPGD